jgi:hypothetical protein
VNHPGAGTAGGLSARSGPAESSALVGSLTALALYAALSVAIFGRVVILHPLASYVGLGFDPSVHMWSLVWWPYALAHRLNPFITQIIWFPARTNLLWAVSIPGPSLAVYPITRWLGTVAAFNLLCLLAPTTAAWMAFLLCRQVRRSFWPALIGGYVYGFSSYMLGQMLSHLYLTLVFAVPLAVYLVVLRLDKAIGARAFVLMFTLTVLTQFLISAEIFATMTAFGAVALALAYLYGRDHWRPSLRSTVPLIGLSYGLCAVILAPAFYFILPEPPPIQPVAITAADLLNYFIPTVVTLVGHRQLEAYAKLINPTLWYSEKGAYLGPALLAMILLFTHDNWRTPLGRLLVTCIVLAFIFSFGPVLHAAGAAFIPMPWALAMKLPLIDQALPIRFPMYVWLVTAVVVTVNLADSRRSLALRVPAAVFCIVFILPNVFYFGGGTTSRLDTPQFFLSGIYRSYIAKDSTVLILPYGIAGNSMLWQAQSDMAFKMAGGYISSSPPGDYAGSPVVDELYSGNPGPNFDTELETFLAAHQVSAIVVAQRRQHWKKVLGGLGVAPLEVSDVLLYQLAGFPEPH